MKYLFIFMIAVLSVSCKKALDLHPLDSLTPDQAFSTEANLQLYTNSFYNSGIPGGTATFIGDATSDIQSQNLVSNYLNGVFTSQQGTGWDWGALRNINYFLENYKQAPISQDKKNHYAGIARFFRAWFYFEKVKNFNNVPWYNKTLKVDDPDIYKTQDPRTLVMDSVLADITFASTYINNTKDPTSSTVTRAVALALKSRICLYEGTYRKYHTELGLTASANAWLQNAADAASAVMTGGQYSVYSTNSPDKDYRALFISQAPIAAEVMLANTFSETLKRYHDANWTFTSATYGGNISFTKRFINTYLNIDGTRYTDNPAYNTTEFKTEVKNRDKRLYQTIRAAPYKRADGSAAPPDFGQAFTGYQELKFTTDDKSIDTKAANFNSIPIIRYAEVLLNYAEAKAELGTFTATDWTNTIALLRKRGGITNLAMPTTVDAYMSANFFADVTSPVLMEVRRERGVELCSENFRYDDLMRWKQGKLLEKEFDGIYVPAMNTVYDLNEDGTPDVSFVSAIPATKVTGVVYVVINNTTTKLSEGTSGRVIWRANLVKTFQDYKYFKPIPYNELVLNKNLVQNPIWDKP
ncbi:MAG: RagB/SusD family nutrient uptake outer membrane protein [Bacteroidota bacterium]